MQAWYDSRSSEKATSTRGQMVLAEGDELDFPPSGHAAFLIYCASQCGLSRSGGYSAAPITAAELSCWADATMTDLGPIDFQDLLDASRIYVVSRDKFDGHPVPAPWERPMTEEEARAAAEAEERFFDTLMGVKTTEGK